MHGGFWHIFFNMYTLLIFGCVVERIIGSKKFLLFYFICGFGAVALHLGVEYLQMQTYMDKYNIALVENDDGSINLRETMISLREKMGNLSESEQAAAASAIFGKNSMAGWLAIINASDEDFDKLTSAIDSSRLNRPRQPRHQPPCSLTPTLGRHSPERCSA